MNPYRALSFRFSGSEGAILIMPEGAVSEDLENLRGFREYASANMKMWYRYIISTRGREVKNGDVRLVIGCDKATSWGMQEEWGNSESFTSSLFYCQEVRSIVFSRFGVHYA